MVQLAEMTGMGKNLGFHSSAQRPAGIDSEEAVTEPGQVLCCAVEEVLATEEQVEMLAGAVAGGDESRRGGKRRK